MTEQPTPPWLAILARFDIGEVLDLQPGSGTAAPKILATTPTGRFLLRQRRPASSCDDVVAYDHAVIETVAEAGIPTARPLPTNDGTSWLSLDGLAYELFPLVEGLEPFRWGSPAQVRSAAKTLANLHLATAELRPPGRKDWPREHRACDMASALEQTLSERFVSSEQVTQAQRMLRSEGDLCLRLSDEAVASLPQVITHGDYTPANVSFRGGPRGDVGGVFDFDWVSRQPRLVDIGEAAQFFACRRTSPLDASSIWSLVEAWQPDTTGLRIFLDAYQAVSPLSEAEARALPYFMTETWLGVRVRAMRKVPPEQRLEILVEGALGPLIWLEGNTVLLGDIASRLVA